MYMFMYDNNNKDNILIIIIINKSTEKSEKNFLRMRRGSTPLGGLTRQLLKEGTTIDARIVNRNRSASPHF